MDMCYCNGDDGRAYYVKGHVDIAEFKAALADEVDKGDPILAEDVSYCWMRICRDFQQEHSVIAEAAPNSRGAFRVTWVQDS